MLYFPLLRWWKAVNQYLISWPESERHELKASEVLCITPNLRWAYQHLTQIREDLKVNDEKKYRYIIYSTQLAEDAAAAVKNANELIDDVKNHSIPGDERISILFLTKTEPTLPKYLWSAERSGKEVPPLEDWVYLPLPTDLVVYINTLSDVRDESSRRKTFAVMSVSPITTKTELRTVAPMLRDPRLSKFKEQLMGLKRLVWMSRFEYDIQISNAQHYDPIIKWFRSKWETVS
jgi:hypothetical protein